MHAILDFVASLLERAEILASRATIRGYVGEQLVTFALKIHVDGSLTEKWTEASVAAPAGLLLWVRPPAVLDDRANAHLAGDPAFDRAILVEGAPTRIVRELLADQEIRRNILLLAGGRPTSILATTRDATTTEGVLVFKIPDWGDDRERAALLVQTIAQVGAVCAESARARRDEEIVGYRGEVAGGGRSGDEQEMRDLTLRLAKREVRTQWIVRGFVVLIILLVGSFVVVVQWLGWGAGR